MDNIAEFPGKAGEEKTSDVEEADVLVFKNVEEYIKAIYDSIRLGHLDAKNAVVILMNPDSGNVFVSSHTDNFIQAIGMISYANTIVAGSTKNG